MTDDGQTSDHSDYIRSIGDGVTSGIRDGIRSGTRRGSRRGIAAGIRDCLARGLVGAGGGSLDALVGHIAVSDVDLSSVRGRLDEAGRAIVRQIRYRVRETDKVRDAVDSIKQRVVSELPANPLSGVIGRKAQESLDGGLGESPDAGQGDVAPEVSAADAGKVAGAVRKNVRSGVEEVASFLVYTIVREVTNRAIAEASRGMKDKAVRRLERRLVKLERRLGTRSDKGLDKALVESIDQVERIVTDESLNETSFHAKIDEAFGGSIKDYIAALSARGLSPTGRALAVFASVVGVAALIWAIVYIAALSNGDESQPAANEPTPTVARTAEPTSAPPVATATATSGPTQTGPLPDLVITYIDADDVGSQTVPEYMIFYRIENVGNREAGPSVVHLMVAGKRHCEDEVGAMGPGKGYEGNFSCTVSEYELSLLRVCADGFNQVAELDEDNNCAEYEYQ
jgi:hypothetical protein